MSSCFVKGCRNGYRSIREENIRLGKKQKCLFKSPKCPELKKKWCHALGLQEDQLKPSHAICEDHFKKSDIVKYDVIHLPDGTKVLLEKGRVRLNPEAVPCRRTIIRSSPNGCQVSNIGFKEQDQTPIEIQGARSNVVVDVQKVLKPIEIEHCYTKDAGNCLAGNSEAALGSPELIKATRTEERAFEDPGGIQPAYSFQKLIEDINRFDRLSRWVSVVNGVTIDFLYWDGTNFRIKMVLRVDTDLAMKLFTADKHLIKNVELAPRSYRDILQRLTLLEKTTICEGTGFNQKRSEECLGEIDVSLIQKRCGAWKRCQPCRELRQKEVNRQRELKKDVRNRLKLTNRKNSRLKIKVDKLKQDVERAKKKCAGIEEKTLYTTIAALPQPIQESVRTCLAAAKVKPTGRRYTMNWINECMVIRMKSRRVYEYLRTHFILPLPCIDTLDKYMKKMKQSEEGLESSTTNCEAEKFATTTEVEETDSLLLDEMNLTERLGLDTVEINPKLDEL